MRYAIVATCLPIIAVLLAGCTDSTTGTPVAASITSTASSSGGQSSATTTSAPSLDVSPPATSAPNPRVTSTSFDGCAAVTKTDEITWELDPREKRDTSGKDGPLGAEGVRGCIWDGPKGQVRVYAFDGSIPKWQQANGYRFDRIEPTRFGKREGVVAHKAPDQIPGCIAILPSQNGLAAVAALPAIALEDAGVDMCPYTAQIMATIEPRIP